jgi:hypothetical protein
MVTPQSLYLPWNHRIYFAKPFEPSVVVRGANERKEAKTD